MVSRYDVGFDFMAEFQNLQKRLLIVERQVGSGSGLNEAGIIRMWAGPNTTLPPRSLICDGSAISRPIANGGTVDTYVDLFAITGTVFGAGNGTSTFNLPRFNMRVPVGPGQIFPGLNKVLGQTGGEENHTLTAAEIPSHTHPIRGATAGAPSGTGDRFLRATTGDDANFRTGNGVNINDQTYGSAATGDGQHNNMQPYLVVNFIISY